MRRLLLLVAALSLASFILAGVSCQITPPTELPDRPEARNVTWTVPGYGVLNGTGESSVYTNRTFYGFRSVYYAEMPTPETRFLVRFLVIIRCYN